MKLILIRHGETQWVREGRYQGASDVPLNRRGVRQARRAALAIKKERPVAVFSSQLLRARETAKFIAETCRKQVRTDKRLNEISFGKWEGASHDEIRLRFPEASRKWYDAPWINSPPGGESLKSLERRCSSFLKELLRTYSGREETCAIVTHGGPIRMFLIHMLKIEPHIFWSIRIDPGSISVFHLTSERRELILLNSQHHLNGSMT